MDVSAMTLALFDLDNTLLRGDSDYEWGQFLVKQGLVDAEAYEIANKRFYEEYKQGTLDIRAFSAFSFTPLSQHSMQTLATLHQQFMQTVIQPMLTADALNLVKQHQDAGHTLMIITATNSFVTRPIADAFGIPNLLATEAKVVNGRYTTEIEDIPCFKEGKVQRLQAWLNAHPEESLKGSYFYSDSHNDLPLLEMVDHPIVVNPDNKLQQVAIKRRWSILQLS
jgi:HAD superfamily hydrolase (TIGR01490 family)